MIPRRTPRFLAIPLALAFAALMALAPTPASAHDPSIYWTHRLQQNGGTFWVYVTPSVPQYIAGLTSSSMNAWNNIGVSNMPRIGNAGRTSAAGNADNACAATFTGIYSKSLAYLGPGPVLGLTHTCPDGMYAFPYRASIIIANNPPLCAGEAPYCPTPGTFDVKSTYVHELGHMLGANHMPAYSCPQNSTRLTMCDSNTMNNSDAATPEVHDWHTAQSAYSY